MKPLLITSFLFLSGFIFGQSFQSDWSSYQLDHWKVDFNRDTNASFIRKKKLGEVVFINSTFDVSVRFFVFAKSDIDAVYHDDIEQWYLMQSECMPTGSFQPFTKGGYYYQPDICNECGELVLIQNEQKINAPEKQHCQHLIEALSEYMKAD